MCMYTINLWSYGKHEVIKKEISLLLSSGNVTGQKFFRCTRINTSYSGTRHLQLPLLHASTNAYAGTAGWSTWLSMVASEREYKAEVKHGIRQPASFISYSPTSGRSRASTKHT